MACVVAYDLTGSDMPLDQAIYVAATDKIYGVRGQWVFQFNATTGGKEKEFRFVDDALFSESSIVLLGSSLYVAVWRSAFDLNNYPDPSQDIFKIDLGLNTAVGLGLYNVGGGGGPQNGFCNLITDGTHLYGATGYTVQFSHSRRFKVDPTNIATYVERNAQASKTAPVVDLVWDAVNSVFWEAESYGPEVDGYYQDIGTLLPTPRSVANPTPTKPCYGIALAPGTKLYVVTKSSTIFKVNGNEAVAGLPGPFGLATWSSLLLLQSGARPIKIKYNPFNGLIYVPTWAGNTVEVLDPATDTIVAIKTGFNTPLDVVCTPTKVFAVQNSATGLKLLV